MGIVQKITKDRTSYQEGESQKASRVWPIDSYDIPQALRDIASEYHVLKVPLLGQHYRWASGAAGSGAQDWCGRTSSSMAYNYYELLKGGDPKPRYISHWNGGVAGRYLDLRFPNGKRAFHANPDGAPFDKNDGSAGSYLVTGASGAAYPADGELPVPPSLRFPDQPKGKFTGVLGTLQFQRGYLYEYPAKEPEQKKRLDDARAIAASKEKLDERFRTMLTAFRANNPIVMFSGFSGAAGSKDGAIHIILLSGYFYIPENGKDQLWIVCANPATVGQLIAQKLCTAIAPEKENDIGSLSKLNSTHDLIRIDGGDWYEGRASLSLIRARRFFEPQTMSNVPYDLMMDYWCSDADHSAKGGYFFYSHRPTDAPPEVVVTSRRASTVSFPLDGKTEAPNPVRTMHANESGAGGYYPLGLAQNVHGGVHLSPQDASAALTPVRAIAPGYVVAARLAGALPKNLATGNPRQGIKQSALVADLSGGSNGFVLLRHVLEEILPTGASGTPKTFTFYSLSMHLESPDWSQPELAKEHAAVSWLNRLVRRRNGSVQVVDPTLPEAGQKCLPAIAMTGKKVMTGGTISAFGDTFASKADVSLGPNETGRVTAVVRGADPDVKEALDALAVGKVVTFCKPSLVVDRGETLGLIAGKGFLHWELCAPSGAKGGLEELFAFALPKLGLDASLMKTFKEITENNLFDQKDGELKTLLSFLPSDDGADKTNKLDPDYDADELRKIMQRSDGLAFAVGAKPSKPEELVFPLTLAIEDFRGAMPPGTRTLKMKFDPPTLPERTITVDPKAGKLEVMVPAAAKKIFFESTDCFIELGSAITTPAEDAALFKKLASARLRNVLLDHLNAWHKDGLLAEMKARFENEESELLPYVSAAAFWANNEEAVIGEDGAEKPLFASSPDAEQLPKDTRLVHAHPTLLTWLLGLLVKHGMARFVSAFPPVAGTEKAEALLLLAWMPGGSSNQARLVGDSVFAVAASVGEGDGTKELTLQATIEGGKGPLTLAKGKCVAGLLHAAVPCPFWGKIKLEVPSQTPEVALCDLNVLVPMLSDLPAPVKDAKTGKYALTLPFAKNRPSRIEGFVVMKTWVVETGKSPEGQGVEAGIAIPIEAMPPPPQATELTYDATGQFIIGAKNEKSTSVTANFSFAEYKKAAGGGAVRLSRVLAERVQKLRIAFGEAQTKAKASSQGLSLVTLASTGLSVEIACSVKDAKSHERLVAAAKGLGADFDTVFDLSEKISVSVPMPAQGGGGNLLASFDPSAAFGKLLADQKLGATEELHVCFGVIFQNGGRLVRGLKSEKTDLPGVGYVEAAPSALREEAAVIEAFASAASTKLRKPQFGPMTVSVLQSGLVLSAPLVGSATDWANAKPVIAFTSKAGKEEVIGSKVKGSNVVSGTIALDDKRVVASKIKFEAKVTNVNATFDGEKIAVAPVSMEHDTTPKLGEVKLVWTATALELRCQTTSFPTVRVMEVGVFAQGATGDVDTGLVNKVRFSKPYTEKKHQGFPDETGLLLARLDRREIVGKKLVAGTKLRLELRRPKGLEVVVTTKIDPISVTTEVPAE